MSVKATCEKMRVLINNIIDDMDKAIIGNKAAAQRIRKNSIAFAKVAKLYRKESVKSGKSKGTKRKAATKRKVSGKKASAKKAPAKKAPAKKRAAKKAVKRPATKKRTTRRTARKSK